MAVILLPTTPLPQSATPKPLDYGSWQEPTMGGPITRMDRLGNRFAMDVVMPRMKPEPDGRIWASRLVRAIGGAVQMPFPQVGLTIGNPGSPVVNGVGVLGSTLPLRGLVAGYQVREGQFLNVVDAAGRAYLHQASAAVTVASDGRVNVPIEPMLRMSPADGSAVTIANPVIEGRLSGNENGWTLERAGTRGLQFTITELR